MSAYSRDKEAAPTSTPIYRELYHKHGLGQLLDEAYVEEWHEARMERRDGSVPWAAVVGIAAMLDMDPRTITYVTMHPRELTVERAAFDGQGKFTGMVREYLPIEQPKKL